MRFAEEILLLMLRHDTGYIVPVPEWRMSYALAGSVLMDLAIDNKIDTDLETLTVVDGAPTGDALLDPTLDEIASDKEIHTPQYWVERIAQRADDISETAFDRLVGFGILDYDTGGFFSLSNKVARSGPQGCRDHWTGEHLRRIRSDAGAGGVRDRQGPHRTLQRRGLDRPLDRQFGWCRPLSGFARPCVRETPVPSWKTASAISSAIAGTPSANGGPERCCPEKCPARG